VLERYHHRFLFTPFVAIGEMKRIFYLPVKKIIDEKELNKAKRHINLDYFWSGLA